MKKIVSGILCFCAIVGCLRGFVIGVNAVEIEGSAPETEIKTDESGFKYYIIDGEVTICGYVGTETDLVFPSYEEGYPVTCVGTFSFTGYSSIISIEIPDTITKICPYAFEDCSKLEIVFLSNSVTVIGENAFSNCPKLQTVYYVGTQAQWNAIDIQNYNDDLRNAEIVFVTGAVLPGDLDGDFEVSNRDVEYLLWYTLFPDDYPLNMDADFNGDRNVNNQDVEYLLWHTLFPGDYPIV